MAKKSAVLGIDIGGSGIKGAPVDLDAGAFASERHRVETPEASTPQAVAELVREVADELRSQLDTSAPVGVTMPAVVTAGVVRTAANIDSTWIGTDARALFTDALERPVAVLNDADAAGLAEVRHGAGRGTRGVVLVTTLGTGIGSALFVDGRLMPNTELGHLELDGHDAESRASSGVREREDLDWEEWAQRLQRYYAHVENLFWPDLVIVGGGVSKKADKFLPLLHLRAPIVPAQLRNDAGIIGAAAFAVEQER